MRGKVLILKDTEIRQAPEAFEDVPHSPSINPLLIDLILDKVLDAVINSSGVTQHRDMTAVARDVQNIRLVCKLWKERATLKFLEKRSPTEFGGCHFAETWSVSQDEKLAEFLDTMSRSEMIPSNRYKFYESIFHARNKSLMEKFTQLHFPAMTTLEFRMTDFDSISSIGNEISGLVLPKLKTLRLSYVQIGKHFKNHQFQVPNFVKLLLESAINLEEFQFEICRAHFHKDGTNHVTANMCKLIPKCVKKLSLGTLPLKNLHLDILMERELKLDEFKLEFGGVGTSGASNAEKFFKSQSGTLKNLVLHVPGNFLQLPSEKFPRVEELNSLRLKSFGATFVKHICFPDVFPKLAVLDLKSLGDSSSGACFDFISCSKQTMSLVELTLPSGIHLQHLVRKSAKLFPNLKKLGISCPEDIEECLQEVFSCFPKIEDLSVEFMSWMWYGAISGDSLLSGVLEPDCKRIIQNNNFNIVNLKNYQRRSSILNLTKLKKLSLKYCGTLSFTDFSAHFLFLKMTELEELRASRFEMSEDYASKLKNKMKVLDVVFRPFYEFSI